MFRRNDKDLEIIILICIIILLKISLEKSCKKTPCERGMRLILSAALDEKRLACFLQCESKKIQKSTRKLRRNPCKKVDAKELIKANCCVKKRLQCIESIENDILKKINKGLELMSYDECCLPIKYCCK
ncbi:MAG: hypothetical protein RR645_02020 [Clostridium sp.]